MAATAKGIFPEGSAKKLVDMLKGKVPFSRWEAIAAALELSQYLTDLYGNDTGTSAKSTEMMPNHESSTTTRPVPAE